jgi:hypothetical protein
LVTLLAHAKVRTYDQAHRVLAVEIDRQNASVHGPTKQIPAEVLRRSQRERCSALRPCPSASLLDLQFSLRASRRVSNDRYIEFDGRRLKIAPTSKKYVTVLFHPASTQSSFEPSPTPLGLCRGIGMLFNEDAEPIGWKLMPPYSSAHKFQHRRTPPRLTSEFYVLVTAPKKGRIEIARAPLGGAEFGLTFPATKMRSRRFSVSTSPAEQLESVG